MGYFHSWVCSEIKYRCRIITVHGSQCPWHKTISTLRPRQNGRHFPDAIFKWIFLNENVWISINMSLKCVPIGKMLNIPTLVQVMARRRQGDKPLSEPMMVRFWRIYAWLGLNELLISCGLRRLIQSVLSEAASGSRYISHNKMRATT